MSTLNPSDRTRTSQIIEYLCSIRMWVVGCCCVFPAPTTNQQNTTGTAPPAGSLLVGLQAAFPGTNWSDPSVLVRLLLDGARRGRFKRLTNNSNDEFWYIDLFMVRKNPCNKIYRSACSAIKDCYIPETIAPNF